jgi:hypothetical protein
MNKGSPVTCGFAREEELKKWPKLPRPNSGDLDQMVAELDTGTVGIYFESRGETKTPESGTG